MSGHFHLAGEQVKREDMLSRARKIAQILQNKGVSTGDVIAILLRNDTTLYEVVEACRYVGAYYVTLNWHGTQAELMPILSDSGAKVLVGHSNLLDQFTQPLPPDLAVLVVDTPDVINHRYAPSDVVPTAKNSTDDRLSAANHGERLAAVLSDTPEIESQPERFRGMFSYTSGSTGKPKGIKREYDEQRPDPYTVFAGLAKALMQLDSGDRFYIAAPLYHSAPHALTLCCLAAGNVTVFIEPKFDPERFLADVQQHKITHTYIVPTMMIRLLKLPQEVREKYDMSSLRYALSTGSAWPVDVKQGMIDWFGPIFFESYGASELGFMTLISSQESLAKPGSVGKAIAGGSIIILDDAMQPVPTGESGSIYVHLPMFGPFKYTNTQGTLDGLHYQNYTTLGDMGYLDADGYLFINDRKKDMIISGGANIFPAEIEAVLIHMPQIADCAIFGIPDSEFGEMIVLAAQCQPDQHLDIAQVCEFLDGRIARFKWPKKLELHDQLPREDSGKIFKQRLRAAYV
ncbi:AMP-dependent synthetase and ligase [Paraglaciecola sp. T6c]|uniref:AMP-binding protein n=1 Tax=Pseudoalteromonas atlantica (strain T6c / ATCC BAA-1087) TaxID=3042615 RepID=UPI00005C6BBD|nr:AMP-binding protein [Paraglaciecola sp. T6c]ABG39894.1 AMP-dependent synthetase and ligase [Paraglaciecola sp. T6c]